MTGNAIWFAAQLSLTIYLAVTGVAWYWIAIWVLFDVLELIGIIGAAARGHV